MNDGSEAPGLVIWHPNGRHESVNLIESFWKEEHFAWLPIGLYSSYWPGLNCVKDQRPPGFLCREHVCSHVVDDAWTIISSR